jgi:hypothetical protein
MTSHTVIRTNYLKYDNLKQRLEQELSICQYSKDIAEKLKISIPTFFKYKSFLQLEHNRQYITSDEKSFANKIGMILPTSGEIAKTPVPSKTISTLEDNSEKKNSDSPVLSDISSPPVPQKKTETVVQASAPMPQDATAIPATSIIIPDPESVKATQLPQHVQSKKRKR